MILPLLVFPGFSFSVFCHKVKGVDTKTQKSDREFSYRFKIAVACNQSHRHGDQMIWKKIAQFFEK